jgi:NAD(P)-dependent dehydrogenase (short-subunit alcohol dehydrogenase family)
MTELLTGQVALVTGGGSGIGRAIAQALAQAGAVVVVVARTQEHLAETVALIQEAGGQAIAMTADVTDPSAIAAVVRAAEQQAGPVALLVNNAGVFMGIGPLWEVDLDAWWQNLEVNVRGILVCARAVLPGMVARRRGRIINLSSVSVNGGLPYMTGYAISKAAALRLTEKLAQELRDHNVQVFALDPGLVYTPMADQLIQSAAGQRWLPMSQGMWEAGAVPPEQAGAAAVFLASAQGDQLSGRYLRVADDLLDLAARAEELHANDLRALRVRM